MLPSTSVTCMPARLSRAMVASPPKPAPTTTTRGCPSCPAGRPGRRHHILTTSPPSGQVRPDAAYPQMAASSGCGRLRRPRHPRVNASRRLVALFLKRDPLAPARHESGSHGAGQAYDRYLREMPRDLSERLTVL